jgi:hypothetical protein
MDVDIRQWREWNKPRTAYLIHEEVEVALETHERPEF